MNEEVLAEQNNGYFNTRQKKCKFGSKCYNTIHKHPKNFIIMLKLQIMFGKHHGVEDRTIGSGQCRLPEAQTERGNFLLHQGE